MKKIDIKLRRLQYILKRMGSFIVACSGGVDSTFLLKAASGVPDVKILAVTFKAPMFPEREYFLAKRSAVRFGIKHFAVQGNALANPVFTANPLRRCYHCKKKLFRELKKIAKKKHYRHVIDGTNYDDAKDFRPGAQALAELGVRSPLKEAGLTKKEIRLLSRRMGLATWDEPAQACLATRIPHGDTITRAKLNIVGKAEAFLRSLGFRQNRVRFHARGARIARIEVLPADIKHITSTSIRARIARKFKTIGFRYVTVDVEGYRTGSLSVKQ